MIAVRIQMKVFAAFCAFACAAIAPSANAKDQYHIQFVPQDGQDLSWNRGVPSIDSPAQGSVVRITDSRDQLPDDQTTFRVTILNAGAEPVELSHENIWIEDAEGNRVPMLSHEELAGRHRRDVKRRQALAALSGALSAASANGYTSGSFNYSGTTTGGTYFSGFGTYSAYDPALALQQRQMAAAQSEATFNAIQVRQLAGEDALNGMLRRTTLNPGEVTSGIVAFDPPRSVRKNAGQDAAALVVRVGALDHQFRIKLVELP